MVDFARARSRTLSAIRAKRSPPAQVAELEPGDVLFYPAMWWHQVEARDAFNVMINYWWNTSPRFMDSPQNTLLHALLSLRDRPDAEKRGLARIVRLLCLRPGGRSRARIFPNMRAAIWRRWTKRRRGGCARMLLNRLNR